MTTTITPSPSIVQRRRKSPPALPDGGDDGLSPATMLTTLPQRQRRSLPTQRRCPTVMQPRNGDDDGNDGHLALVSTVILTRFFFLSLLLHYKIYLLFVH